MALWSDQPAARTALSAHHLLKNAPVQKHEVRDYMLTFVNSIATPGCCLALPEASKPKWWQRGKTDGEDVLA
jgi:hypothetical protein